MASHSASVTIKQVINQILLMDTQGHISRGYYENAVTGVVDGFGYLNDNNHGDEYAVFICGFPASMSGQSVTVTTDGFTSQFTNSGTQRIVFKSDMYDLMGRGPQNAYCLSSFKTRYPHSNPFSQGAGKVTVVWNSLKYFITIKVTGNKNYDNCGN